MTTPSDATRKRFEEALERRDETWYDLTLIVSGASALSARAIANARRLCDTHLQGRYRLSVVDLYEQPGSAANENVLAAPTLIRNQPLPVRKVVGDLSHTNRVLHGLGLPVTDAPEASH